MITKERLEELAEQGKPVWAIGFWSDILEVDSFTIKGGPCVSTFIEFYDDEVETERWLEEVFETEAEAEHHRDFGEITRTEVLRLPTFEEAKDMEEGTTFYTFGNREIIFEVCLDYNRVRIEDASFSAFIFDKPLTKENYREACEACKKLFLGEQ